MVAVFGGSHSLVALKDFESVADAGVVQQHTAAAVDRHADFGIELAQGIAVPSAGRVHCCIAKVAVVALGHNLPEGGLRLVCHILHYCSHAGRSRCRRTSFDY